MEQYNKNNGYIRNNTTVSDITNISNNINNGNIEGAWSADVTDTIVNKTT